MISKTSSLTSGALLSPLFQWRRTCQRFPSVHFSQVMNTWEKSVFAYFIGICHLILVGFLLTKSIHTMDIVQPGSDSNRQQRTTEREERERERERERGREREDLHQPVVNRISYTTPMRPWLIPVGQIWEQRYVSCNSVWLGNMWPSQKNLEVASPIWKATATRKVALWEALNSSSLASGEIS